MYWSSAALTYGAAFFAWFAEWYQVERLKQVPVSGHVVTLLIFGALSLASGLALLIARGRASARTGSRLSLAVLAMALFTGLSSLSLHLGDGGGHTATGLLLLGASGWLIAMAVGFRRDT